jgi:MFS family permease
MSSLSPDRTAPHGAPNTSPPDTDRVRRTRFIWTVAAVALASIVLPFSVSGTAVALPALAHDLGAPVDQTQWVQNAFNLTFAALAMASGSLADRFGRQRVLRAGIATVGVTALLIAVCSWLPVIDVLRALQGCGAAAVLAAGAAVLANAARTDHERTLAFTTLGTAFGAGLALGPTLAGFLVSATGWRGLFVVVAIAAGAAWVLARQASETRDPQFHKLDLPGLITFTASLTCVSLVFADATVDGWASPATWLPLIAAALLMTAFVVIEARHPETAMFDVRLFRQARFVALVCQPFAVTLGFMILLAYLPPYLQGVGGHSIVTSGLMMLPLTLPVLIMPIVGGKLAARTSVRLVLVGAGLLEAAGAVTLLTLAPTNSALALCWPLLLFGIGVGLAFGVMDNAAISAVPVQKAGAASGIFNTMRLSGESIAIAAAIAVLTTVTSSHLNALPHPPSNAAEIAGQAAQGQIDGAYRAVLANGLTSGFHLIALVVTALCAVGAVLTFIALNTRRAS